MAYVTFHLLCAVDTTLKNVALLQLELQSVVQVRFIFILCITNSHTYYELLSNIFRSRMLCFCSPYRLFVERVQMGRDNLGFCRYLPHFLYLWQSNEAFRANC